MGKKLLTKEHIENIPELGELPIGKVLLLGMEPEESDVFMFFQQEGREVVTHDGNGLLGAEGPAYEEVALAICTREVDMGDAGHLERLFLELNSALTKDGILIAFFPSEGGAKEANGTFYSNRDIEQMVSRTLSMVRISTMMDGTRRVVARKQDSFISS